MPWLAAELPPNIPAACVVQAAAQYALPEVALVAIWKQERGEVGKAYPRSSGTYYGPFQISDKWLPHFAKWGWTEALLRDNACANVVAGAYVLAYYRAREGGSWSRAIARYNVGSLNTPERLDAGFRYAEKVRAHWEEISRKWRAGR